MALASPRPLSYPGGLHPVLPVQPSPLKTFSKATTFKVRDFPGACRRSSSSPAFLGFQRCDVPKDARPRLGSWGSRLRAYLSPRPPRAPPRAPAGPHSSPPPARALHPPAPAREPRSRTWGWGSRGRRRLLRPLPLARPLPPSSPGRSHFLPLWLSRPLKVRPNFFSPGRARRAHCEGRLLCSSSLRCLPSRRWSSGNGRHEVAPWRSSPATRPSSPASSSRPPSRGTAASRAGSAFPLLPVPLRQLSRRDRGGNLPPLSPPPASSLRPFSTSHWNQFLGGIGAPPPPPRRTAFPRGSPGHRRGHVSR